MGAGQNISKQLAVHRSDSWVLRWACSFGLGVFACHSLPELPGVAWCVVLIMLSMLLLSHRGSRWLLACVIGFCWAWYSASAQLAGNGSIAGTADYEITGSVAEFPVHAPGRSVFEFAVEAAIGLNLPKRLRLSWYEPTQRPQIGDRWRLEVRLKRPSGSLNPGGFDFERWLFVKGLGATGYVRDAQLLSRVGLGPSQVWRGGLAGIRGSLAERLRSGDGDTASALLQALVLGTRHGFQDEHWQVLRRTGTSHLVAISGLHVGLVAVLMLALLRPVLVRLPIRAVAERAWPVAGSLGLLAASVYAALAGFTLPTQRALVMLAVGVVALWLNRRVGTGATLGIALVLVLLWDPLATLSPGFWLSFVAVATLIQVSRVRRIGGRHRAIELVRTQWLVGIGLMPCLTIFFGEVNALAPWVNLIAIPWFSLVLVPVILLGVFLAVILPGDTTRILDVIRGLCELTWQGLEWVDARVSLLWPMPELPIGLLVVMLMAVVLLALPIRQRGRNLLLGALVGVCLWRPPALPPGAFSVHLWDVGQGLAMLIRTRHHSVIYDTGPVSPYGFNAATAIVLPALQARGVEAPDLLMLSHGDNDHAGGAVELQNTFKQIPVLAGGVDSGSRGRPCRRGQRWRWDEVEFRVLYPSPTLKDSSNNLSCVLRVEGSGGSVLLTGDIERRAERRLLLSGETLAADVVIVPHHGSNSSSSAAFVAAVAPSFALVAAGFDNRWGFPKTAVVERWEAQGARLFSTSQTGAIELTVPAKRSVSATDISLFRGNKPRYWRRKPSFW
jgi:competence protein ComEC